jgi:hypothetical protein
MGQFSVEKPGLPGSVLSGNQQLAEIEYPGNDQIPSPDEEYYLFAGEIGWSRNFGSSLRNADGVAGPRIGEAFSETKQRVIEKSYSLLTDAERARFARRNFEPPFGRTSLDLNPETFPNEVVKVQSWEKIPGIPVEIPAFQFRWESYHSQENVGSNVDYPAPALVDVLRLRKCGASIDLVNEDGKVATIYRECGTHSENLQVKLLYLRSELAERYLYAVGRNLVWINWGERSLSSDILQAVREDSVMRTVWDAHGHIHKQFYVYHNGKAIAQRVGETRQQVTQLTTSIII